MEEYLKITGKKEKKSKYLNKRTVYNGISYQSKAEAGYAEFLDHSIKAIRVENRVLSWKRQVKFPIEVSGKHICNYILDFEVDYLDGRKEYIDVKGYQKGVAYSIFTIKKKLVEAIYEINIIEHTNKTN